VIASPLLLSLRVTLAATLILGVAGLALAHLLARHSFRGKSLVETLILLPLVLPPSVVGYYLLVAMGQQNPLVRALGADLLFSAAGATIAAAVVGLPLMVQASRAALQAVPVSVLNAARLLGSTEWEVFVRVTLPLARRGIIAGLLLGGARAFGEFGATLMVAGSIPGRTQTVPLAIYDAVQSGDAVTANALVLLTTVLAFAGLWVVRRLEAPAAAGAGAAVGVPAAAGPAAASPSATTLPANSDARTGRADT
jgi:molybdate transport system permease protein